MQASVSGKWIYGLLYMVHLIINCEEVEVAIHQSLLYLKHHISA